MSDRVERARAFGDAPLDHSCRTQGCGYDHFCVTSLAAFAERECAEVTAQWAARGEIIRQLEAQLAKVRATLVCVAAEAENYGDGAPDAGASAHAHNRIHAWATDALKVKS